MATTSGPKDSNVTRAQVVDKIKDILSEQIGISKDLIKEESHFTDDFALDSLDQVEIIMRFEEAFDINIPDDVAERMLTVGDVIKYVEENM